MKQNAYNWNEQQYAKYSCAQFKWAKELIAIFKLQGDEAVLDIGCGDGKVTTLIADRLTEEDRVEIRGLCWIFVKEYGAYPARNPKTGEQVKIAPKKLPCFKPGKKLEERVDR
ncbi:MAG: HU family DNA-binding protein [Desulfobacteraceae bacterium]|jgi:nucleoid DNA-binding protein|nr:HU family DNA-binding protein [Desulfobacteraceae bacterium]